MTPPLSPMRLLRMSELSQTDHTAPENQRLVELVSAVLVDPNLHTDLRMRLQEEIRDLLQPAQTRSVRAVPTPPSRRVSGDHLPDLLEAVLSDPNLHTELRMRLHQEIPTLVARAREQEASRAAP
jgi:hypothetical protein